MTTQQQEQQQEEQWKWSDLMKGDVLKFSQRYLTCPEKLEMHNERHNGYFEIEDLVDKELVVADVKKMDDGLVKVWFDNTEKFFVIYEDGRNNTCDDDCPAIFEIVKLAD